MAYIAIIEGENVPVSIGKGKEGSTIITIGDREHVVDPEWTQRDLLSLIIDGRSYQVDIHSDKDIHEVLIEGEHFEFELFDERKALLKKSAALGAEGLAHRGPATDQLDRPNPLGIACGQPQFRLAVSADLMLVKLRLHGTDP